MFFNVEVEYVHFGPFGLGDGLVGAGGVVLHDATREGSIDKGAELVDGGRQCDGYLMAAVFETHDPIVIFVFGEDFRHTLCSEERGAERTTEAAVVDDLVGSAMEHACWSGLGGIFKRIVATHNATGIGYDGGRDEACGEVGCGGQLIHTAVVGLQHGDGAGTAAGEHYLGGVDFEFASMVPEIGDGIRAVLDGIADGGVEEGIHLEQRHFGGVLEIETIVDGDSHKAPVCQKLAALGGILVVALTGHKATAEDVEDAGMVGARVLRLVDIEFQLKSVARGEGIGLLCLAKKCDKQNNNHRKSAFHKMIVFVIRCKNTFFLQINEKRDFLVGFYLSRI